MVGLCCCWREAQRRQALCPTIPNPSRRGGHVSDPQSTKYSQSPTSHHDARIMGLGGKTRRHPGQTRTEPLLLTVPGTANAASIRQFVILRCRPEVRRPSAASNECRVGKADSPSHKQPGFALAVTFSFLRSYYEKTFSEDDDQQWTMNTSSASDDQRQTYEEQEDTNLSPHNSLRHPGCHRTRQRKREEQRGHTNLSSHRQPGQTWLSPRLGGTSSSCRYRFLLRQRSVAIREKNDGETRTCLLIDSQVSSWLPSSLTGVGATILHSRREERMSGDLCVDGGGSKESGRPFSQLYSCKVWSCCCLLFGDNSRTKLRSTGSLPRAGVLVEKRSIP
ncbi:hypothetical protein BDZ89DRAFT_1046296 [Hymenopellis radicata]|nr:hypothetical protein BDZ89DRAFT_1046296 [Hymenopellis radicata]